MDFISWWFEEHWFWSTLLTPAMTFAWCCFKGLFWRGVVSFLLAGFITVSSTSRYQRS